MGGGGGGLGGIVKDAVSVMFPVASLGSSMALASNKVTGGLASGTPGSNVVKAGQSIYDNISGKNARNAQKDLMGNLAAQQAASNDIQRQLLAAPKNVSPDNFLAMKNRQLQNLRMGFMSTITGPSGALSAPSLNANGPGKTKLGQ